MNITLQIRKRWFPIALFLAVVTVPISAVVSADQPSARFDPITQKATLTNGRLELVIDAKEGINPCSLRDLKSGRGFADADYSWPKGIRPTLAEKPVILEKDGVCSVTLKGKLDVLEIEQTFTASAAEPGVIAEQITLHNPNDKLLDTSSFACGFTKTIHDGKDWLPGVAASRLCDVPYRRQPESGAMNDFTVPEFTAKKKTFYVDRSNAQSATELMGAEGWAWYGGENTLLISKYNPDALEWSLLNIDPTLEGKAKSLRFGGAGRWKLGDPEGAAQLEPGAAFKFGITRYQVLDGDWRAAYAAFRRFTESKGHRFPPKYDPPVHWNELYDNKYWWLNSFTEENLKKYYQRKDMEVEADKAKEFGCQCLYLDPGWDTVLGSTLWAEDRLGTQDSFVRWLKEKYNMSLALHTPLAPWSDPAGYPLEAHRMDKTGNRLGEVCCASSIYVETKSARLKELCKHGAFFLMYDCSWFPGECWDKSHGHSLPVTHQEHLDAILEIQQQVHQEYPKVLIEQHDPIAGPGTVRYAPTYFMHAKPGAFNELWGYEYMWNVMDDILSRRACSLYYVNLAYDIPIYLHINLKNDNDQAMVFWWYASTCRHLGVGGKHADPAVWEAQKKAMKMYLSLKRFYTQGVFYGLDETIHCHTLPDLGESVLNIFNLDDKPAEKEIRFRLSDIGLPKGSIKIEGAASSENGDEIILKLTIPPRGHQLVKIKAI
jgi:hypothetical protein